MSKYSHTFYPRGIELPPIKKMQFI
jgi:hypothetical protein